MISTAKGPEQMSPAYPAGNQAIPNHQDYPPRADAQRLSDNVKRDQHESFHDAAILRALGVVIKRDEQNVAQPVASELVSVCAWCDWDKSQTRALLAQGKRVTHGICPAHAQRQIERARALNRQAAGGLREEAA